MLDNGSLFRCSHSHEVAELLKIFRLGLAVKDTSQPFDGTVERTQEPSERIQSQGSDQWIHGAVMKRIQGADQRIPGLLRHSDHSAADEPVQSTQPVGHGEEPGQSSLAVGRGREGPVQPGQAVGHSDVPVQRGQAVGHSEEPVQCEQAVSYSEEYDQSDPCDGEGGGGVCPESVEEDFVSSDYVIKVSIGRMNLNMANEIIDEFYDNSYPFNYVERSVDKKRVKVLIPESANNFECEYCDKGFKYKATLKRHLEEYHISKSEVLSCEYCKLVFRRQEHLKNHLKTESCLKNSNSTFECKFCKKVFGCNNKLKNHVSKNCLKKYFCQSCCIFFRKKADYLLHSHQ